jgi:hypothetical protein
MKYSNAWLAKTVRCWDGSDLSYCDSHIKKNAHDRAARVLQSFAIDYLRLDKSQFTVRSNKAGVACSGEVTLHTDKFDNLPFGIYIQVGQNFTGETVLYRACNDTADYHGYRNNWISFTKAFGTQETINEFCDTVRRLCANDNQSRI